MFFPLARGGASELETFQERYMTCLKTYVDHQFPQQPCRFHDLLVRLPEVSVAMSNHYPLARVCLTLVHIYKSYMEILLNF